MEEVRGFVAAHERFKVLGTRHCFNNIADSRDGLLVVEADARRDRDGREGADGNGRFGDQVWRTRALLEGRAGRCIIWRVCRTFRLRAR